MAQKAERSIRKVWRGNLSNSCFCDFYTIKSCVDHQKRTLITAHCPDPMLLEPEEQRWMETESHKAYLVFSPAGRVSITASNYSGIIGGCVSRMRLFVRLNVMRNSWPIVEMGDEPPSLHQCLTVKGWKGSKKHGRGQCARLLSCCKNMLE